MQEAAAFDAAVYYQELVGRFYSELLWELGEHARRGGTAMGAGAVAKRVAQKYRLPKAAALPVPRWNRAELEGRADSEWAAQIGPRALPGGRR